jgi:hypothetical protein
MGNTSLTEYKTELTVNGTLTVNGGYVETALKVPGAQLPPGTGNVAAYNPIYDNILGVFNLFEQPKFQLTKFPAPDVDIISYWSFQNYNYTISNDLWPVFPEINQLMIKTPPKLVINPASGLKLKSVDYQIVFENQESNEIEPISLQGPMIPGPLTYHQSKFGEGPYHATKLYEPSITNREKLMSSMGYELEILSNSGSWNGASIATPYLNQDCFSDFSLFSYSTIKNPQLRVKAIFEPIDNDPHSTVQEVILIHTFNGIIENMPNTKNYVVTGTPNLSVDNPNYAPIGIDLPIDESVLLFGIPSNVLFSNDTISSDISAIGDITIGNNVTIGPGNFTVKTSGNIYFDKSLNAIPANSSINFIAGEEIIVSPEAIVSPEVVLSIDPSIIKPCEKAEDIVPTSLEIANFCNGPVYAERSSSKSILISDVYDNLEENKNDQSVWDFTIYPNPTTSTSTVVLSGNNETNYNIEVTDMMGKVVYTKGNRAETTQTVLDLTGISKGVYFVKVNTLLGTKMKHLVIQ